MNRSTDVYRQKINQVIDHLNNNLDRSVSLEELASVAFLSRFHFHRVFVAVMGETVYEFTSRLRNEKVARLLTFSKTPIASIAVDCGYTSAATLSRAFKHYLGVSPSAYRKGAKIKNSKIRKELQPISQYHCAMEQTELEQRFPVHIEQLPKRRIAYIRVNNAFKEGVVIQAFTKLIAWSKEHSIYDSGTIFGMSKSDPEVTPKKKYSYESCITLPTDFQFDLNNLVQTTILPACKYAFTTVSGDIKMVTTAINYLFDNWLINSDYECETQPGLEIFLKKEKVGDWSHFDLKIGIPVKSPAKSKR